MTAKRRETARRIRAHAAALPAVTLRRPSRGVQPLRVLAPTHRSLLAGLVVLAAALGAYVLARETAMFAVRRIVVVGAPPEVAAQVRRALAPLRGTSLVALDGPALERRVDALPTVVDVAYDRAFPHTLRVTVTPERVAAVVRSGSSSWLVSARGRIMRQVGRGSERGLARIWLPARTSLRAGSLLPLRRGGAAAQALWLAPRLAVAIRSATVAHGGALVFRLRSGAELRLGEPADLRLKLAVARRALAALPAGTTYLDVSLPGRPVAGADGGSVPNPQVSTGG